jgi:ring-1,2-phenylacetyl-CoA epoxidase subunit PaaD
MKPTEQDIWQWLEAVVDPEIPALSITDMGIVRQVTVGTTGAVEISITPTYSGCPAMDMITVNIKAVLQERGLDFVTVTSLLSPAWTTDWITPRGREKLLESGIAPPQKASPDVRTLLPGQAVVPCPLCGSSDTALLSQFGSTACKALYRCNSCREPFDHFKCH